MTRGACCALLILFTREATAAGWHDAKQNAHAGSRSERRGALLCESAAVLGDSPVCRGLLLHTACSPKHAYVCILLVHKNAVQVLQL